MGDIDYEKIYNMVLSYVEKEQVMSASRKTIIIKILQEKLEDFLTEFDKTGDYGIFDEIDSELSDTLKSLRICDIHEGVYHNLLTNILNMRFEEFLIDQERIKQSKTLKTEKGMYDD